MPIFCPVCNYSMQPGVPCRTCAEIEEQKRAATEEARQDAVRRLGGPKAYHEFTLERYVRPDKADILQACAGFPGRNLFLWGGKGVGKSHLAVALARSSAAALVVKPQKIYRDLRGHKAPRAEEAALNRYIHREPLVIDDLCTEKRTDFSFSALYEIIEGRDMQYKKGLIITCNLNLLEVARVLDDRISSRIYGLCGSEGVIEITGPDRRVQGI